jgi:DNA-directed RNA polymerase subunit E"
MKKKVCKKCKLFYDGPICPMCKESHMATSWQGRINIIDANKSLIAQKLEVTVKGEYVLKVR